MFIIIMTVAAMVLGGIFLAIRHKKFKGEARFLVNNPLYGDRSTLFRSNDTRWVDYFGGDDDVDKIMESSTLLPGDEPIIAPPWM